MPTQPRSCPYCQSRSLVNQEAANQPNWYRVECLFCHSLGPVAASQEQAWDAWNGDLLRVTPGFGRPEGVI